MVGEWFSKLVERSSKGNWNFKSRPSTLQTQKGTNRREKERRKRELGMDTKKPDAGATHHG